MQLNTLRTKILAQVGIPISVCLIIAAIILVSVMGARTEERIEAKVMSVVQNETLKVGGFFEKYGHLAKTFATEPMMLNWYENHTNRGADLSQDANYQLINQNFIRISSNDDNIYSAFFASELTGEYFRENDITGVNTDYYATKRPWYKKARNFQEFTVGSPTADLTTGKVSAVIQGPLRNDSGSIIGIGGVDLYLEQIGQLINKIQFEGTGHAFLVDDKARIVHFPTNNQKLKNFKLTSAIVNGDGEIVLNPNGTQKKETSGIKPNLLLSDFDTDSNTTGFKGLAKQLLAHKTGYQVLEFMDEQYYVAYQPIKLDFPKMAWSVGLLIPADTIEAPIFWAKVQTTWAVAIVVILISILILVVSSNISKPIRKLSNAMRDVAQGEGDLTKTINVESNDEVGVLADHFNTFISNLRGLLQQTSEHSNLVSGTSEELSDVSSQTNQEIQAQKSEVDSVTTAVTEMAATVLEISRNAAQANTAASDAEQQTSSGLQLSSDAMNEMNALSTSMDEAVQTVAGLGEESKNIGSVIDVINGIAEQTNLLALNAAIEAARAGEQGRGFAVVADEVRSLASRTQESTQHISAMVAKLRNIAEAAEQVMYKGKNQTNIGVEKTKQVQISLDAINNAIATVQEQSGHIAVATEEQTIVAESINQSLHSITSLVDCTADHANELSGKANQLNGASTDLQNIVGRFKV